MFQHFGELLAYTSGTTETPLGPIGTVRVHGFLVWAALLYAGMGTWVTVKIGRPPVALNVDRHRYKADFHFSLVCLRENAERVALDGGEPVELGPGPLLFVPQLTYVPLGTLFAALGVRPHSPDPASDGVPG